MHYFFQNLLYSWAEIRQTKFKAILTKEMPTQIGNFMNLVLVVLVLEHCHIGFIVKNALFLKKILSTLRYNAD